MYIEPDRKIKQNLETVYDIPFDVSHVSNIGGNTFYIKPHNSSKELFVIEGKIKNGIRLVIEVTPEKYAAFSIQDMGAASFEKKRIFTEYAQQLEQRRCKIEFYVNDVPQQILSPANWPENWKNYRIRVSKSPIAAENESVDEAEIIATWSTIVVGMLLSLLNVISDDNAYMEGGKKRVETNRYERNPINRELCLAANGYTCKICGFDFEQTYGDLGHHFIHVHHIVPVSKMTQAYTLDPVSDLIPVCPNCHAMLHRADPPLLPEELKEIIHDRTGAIMNQEELM